MSLVHVPNFQDYYQAPKTPLGGIGVGGTLHSGHANWKVNIAPSTKLQGLGTLRAQDLKNYGGPTGRFAVPKSGNLPIKNFIDFQDPQYTGQTAFSNKPSGNRVIYKGPSLPPSLLKKQKFLRENLGHFTYPTGVFSKRKDTEALNGNYNKYIRGTTPEGPHFIIDVDNLPVITDPDDIMIYNPASGQLTIKQEAPANNVAGVPLPDDDVEMPMQQVKFQDNPVPSQIVPGIFPGGEIQIQQLPPPRPPPAPPLPGSVAFIPSMPGSSSQTDVVMMPGSFPQETRASPKTVQASPKTVQASPPAPQSDFTFNMPGSFPQETKGSMMNSQAETHTETTPPSIDQFVEKQLAKKQTSTPSSPDDPNLPSEYTSQYGKRQRVKKKILAIKEKGEENDYWRDREEISKQLDEEDDNDDVDLLSKENIGLYSRLYSALADVQGYRTTPAIPKKKTDEPLASSSRTKKSRTNSQGSSVNMEASSSTSPKIGKQTRPSPSTNKKSSPTITNLPKKSIPKFRNISPTTEKLSIEIPEPQLSEVRFVNRPIRKNRGKTIVESPTSSKSSGSVYTPKPTKSTKQPKMKVTIPKPGSSSSVSQRPKRTNLKKSVVESPPSSGSEYTPKRKSVSKVFKKPSKKNNSKGKKK